MVDRETQEARGQHPLEETILNALYLRGSLEDAERAEEALSAILGERHALEVRLAEAEEAVRGVDAICEDYAEGRHDAIVALGKIGVLRLYGAASRKEQT